MNVLRFRYLPLALFFLALTPRLILLVATFPGNENVKYYEDVTIANNLIQGRGYEMAYSGLRVNNEFFGALPGVELDPIESRPTAIKPPVYPLVVAVVFGLLGAGNFLALFILHALLAAGTGVLLFYVASSIGPWAGVSTSTLFALYPPFAYHSIAVPESTTLLLFQISLFLFLLLRYRLTRSTAMIVATALVGAAIALTEAVAIPFVCAALAYICFLSPEGEANPDTQSSRRAATHLALAASIIFLAIVPWLYRNYQTFDSFPILRTGIGTNLLLSLRRAEVLPDEVVVAISRRVPGTGEVQEDFIIKQEVVAWIEAHPSAYWGTTSTNFLEYWWETAEYRENDSLRYTLGRRIPYVLLLLVSLPALGWSCFRIVRHPLRSLRADVLPNLALLLIVTYSAVYTVFGAHNIRYHFPVELVLLLFCGQALSLFMGAIGVARETRSVTQGDGRDDACRT